MATPRRTRFTAASAIFDPEDRWARDRGVRGKHPRPIGAIRYSLVARIVDGARRDFDVPIDLVTIRNASGYDVFFDRIEQRGSAVTRRGFVPGTYVLAIAAQFYQAREYLIELPAAQNAQRIDLEPAYNYPFPTAALRHGGHPTLLRGTVHTADGRGMRGVLIEVAGSSNDYRTDTDGQWVLIFDQSPADGLVTVSFKFPDGATVAAAAVGVAAGQERSLVQTALRGMVTTTNGRGIRGARVSVAGHPGETLTTEDGSWFYYFGLAQGNEIVSVIAQCPDGAALTQPNVQVQPRALVVVPSFKVA